MNSEDMHLPATHTGIAVERFMFEGTEEVNVFLAACPETGQAILVDAGGFDERIAGAVAAGNLTVTGIYITHSHYDHVDALPRILDHFGSIPVHAFQTLKPVSTIRLSDNEIFRLGNFAGRVMHIPGHTDDMLVYVVAGRIFSGDVLFAGSVGGTNSEENYRRLVGGIRMKLLHLAEATIIHPGHGPNTTIGLERSYNPFLT